ncbi:hypothetical protein F4604DRAFT_1936022 [Suillus subluteus]|nr:hypothetical protein F4604DRAFT_1936022 [Suillus subluteus]
MILGICQLLVASHWLFPIPLSPLVRLTMYRAQRRPSGAPENQPMNDTNSNPYQLGSPGHNSNPSPYQFLPLLLPAIECWRLPLFSSSPSLGVGVGVGVDVVGAGAGAGALNSGESFLFLCVQLSFFVFLLLLLPNFASLLSSLLLLLLHHHLPLNNLRIFYYLGGTPYLGHSSCTPFSGSESSGSCAPSLRPGGDYGQLLGPAHHQPHMMAHLGFNRGSLYRDSAGYELQNSVSILTARMGSLEEGARLDSDLGQNPPDGDSPDYDGTKPGTDRGKKSVRHNISNKHRALKGLLHPLFYDLCNINSNLAKSKRIKLLCDIKPLETGKPFETDEDSRKIWFPKWQANIDNDVNAAFIQEVVTLMWNNEKDLQEKNGKGEIPDSAYETAIISECAKAYFRNMHKQYKELNDAELGLKALARKTNSKHCSCQQAATNCRQKAAKAYENETGIQGVMAILDIVQLIANIADRGTNLQPSWPCTSG